MKINVDQHFDATPENVSLVLDNYDITAEDYELAATGVENTTLLLASDIGKFALRIYRQNKKEDEAIENEIAFMDYLHLQSIPVPEVIRASNGDQLTHTAIDGVAWQAILMELLEGYPAIEYNTILADNMADLQARLHLVGQGYSAAHSTSPMRNLQDQPFVSSIDRNTLPNQNLAQFLDRAQREVTLSDKLPHGWCHLDLDKGNLLVNNQEEIVGVLDFDDAADVPFVVDLAYAMWAVYYFGSEALAERYRTRYEKSRALSELEVSYLQEVMLFRHYVVSSMFIKHGQHNEASMEKYLSIERSLLQQIAQSKMAANKHD